MNFCAQEKAVRIFCGPMKVVKVFLSVHVEIVGLMANLLILANVDYFVETRV